MKILAVTIIVTALFSGCISLKIRHSRIKWNCHCIDPVNACHWNIIADSGRTSGTVIWFGPEPGRCGVEYVGAVAMIKRDKEQDIIRVILPCFSFKKDSGDIVKIKIIKPVNMSMEIPTSWPWGKQPARGEKVVYRLNQYDKTVLKTVFGRIL